LILTPWERGGWVGVDLFFVLSGFLVSGLLFSEYKRRGQLSAGRFYTRRGWKIYPPFVVLIAASVTVNLLLGRSITSRSLAAELTFLQSYLPGLWNHTWSLSVEEHFYFILPLLLMLMLRLNRSSPEPFKPVLTLAVCLAPALLFLRVLNWYYRPFYDHITHLFPSYLRLDSLFFGVAISYLYHFHTSRFVEFLTPWRRWLILGGLFLLAPAFVYKLEATPFIFTAGFTIFYLGSGMLLVGTLLSTMPRNRAADLAARLGAYSYSIYLWHLPVMGWVVPLVERARWTPLGFSTRALFYLVGSLTFGVVMARAIEVPTLRLRDRWFPDRAADSRPPGSVAMPIPLSPPESASPAA
jgi:peptidoglycan/LPS O-acetylase OafA/YrhL